MAGKVQKHTNYAPFVQALGKYAWANRQALQRAARSAARSAYKYASNSTDRSHARDFKRLAVDRKSPYKRITLPPKNGRLATGPGRSGGFLTTTKVKKNTKRARTSKRGIVFTKETGGTTSSNDAVSLGHVTSPITLMIQCAWRALFKHLFLEAGLDVKDMDESLDLKVNDQVVIYYSATTGGPILNESFLVASITSSIETFVAWVMTPSLSWNINGSADQTQFQAIRFIPTNALGTISHAVTVSMMQSKLHFITKSAMKMQNRTVDVAADNEADDVNNVPLYGTSYEGSGTGTVYVAKKTGSGTQQCFYGHATRGTILSETINEPPEPGTFDKVTRTGKVKIEPGEIKTSVLNHSCSYFWNDFWSAVFPTITDSSVTLRKSIGKFRLFIIEKMIHYAAADTAIQTAYECNVDIMVNLSFSRSFQSVRKFESERGINI